MRSTTGMDPSPLVMAMIFFWVLAVSEALRTH